MWKEEALFAARVEQEDPVILAHVVHFADHVKATKLRNVEFEVNSHIWIEVWVHSALLQTIQGITVVPIESNEAVDRIGFIMHLALNWFWFDGDPLVKTILKPTFGDLHALFTATTTAKDVIAWTEEAPATSSHESFCVFLGYVNLVKMSLILCTYNKVCMLSHSYFVITLRFGCHPKFIIIMIIFHVCTV